MKNLRLIKNTGGRTFKVTVWVLSFILYPSSFFLMTSCKKDFLEIKPQGQLTLDNFFQNESQAVQATNAIYQSLRAWEIHVFAYLGMTDIPSDDADKGSTPTDANFLLDMDNYTFDANNIAPLTVYQGYYKAIFRTNVAINGIPTVPVMNETLRARLIGESKVLRAYYYFNLVRWFGDVAIITKSLNPSEYSQPRAPKAQVYAQIIQDLKDGIASLPEKSGYSAADVGRVTKGTARGLLAKVYLTQGDFVNAETYALQVISSNEYALLPDYSKIFTLEGENSSESVFEVQCIATSTGDGGSQYNEVQGVRGVPNLGWGFNRPSDSFILEFEPGDPRRSLTVLYENEILPDGSDFVHPSSEVFNARFNKKAFVPAHPGGNSDGPGNIRILRYSDVVLMAAEAQNENGKTAEALKNLNSVRKRARGALPASILPDVTETDKTKLRNLIWHERRTELGMEQVRWFDLARTGRLADAMKKNGKTAFVPGKNELFPIPQQEIDLSAGTLTQNPGY